MKAADEKKNCRNFAIERQGEIAAVLAAASRYQVEHQSRDLFVLTMTDSSTSLGMIKTAREDTRPYSASVDS
jgi:hypothetical protein